MKKSINFKSIRNILLVVVFACILVLGCIISVNMQKKAEYLELGFVESTYETIITAPDKDQYNAFKENKNVKGILPFCNYLLKYSQNGVSGKINAFLTDEIASYDITMFNDRTTLDGKIDFDNGVVIDKFLSEKFKTKVGDELNISIGVNSFVLKVSAIVTPCEVMNDGDGVIFGKYTEAMKGAMGDISYTNAFVAAVDNNIFVKEDMKGYFPLGSIDTIQEFEAHLEKLNISDEAWKNYVQTEYGKYKANLIKNYNENPVKLKSDDYNETLAVTKKYKERAKTSQIAFSVVSAILLLLAQLLFFLKDKANFNSEMKNGAKLNVIVNKSIISIVVQTILIAVCGIIAGLIVMLKPIYIASFLPIVLSISLSVFASMAVMIIVMLAYRGSLRKAQA